MEIFIPDMVWKTEPHGAGHLCKAFPAKFCTHHIGLHVMMYGTCAGMSLPGDDKDTTGDASGASSKEGSYPTFELLQISAL